MTADKSACIKSHTTLTIGLGVDSGLDVVYNCRRKKCGAQAERAGLGISEAFPSGFYHIEVIQERAM